MLPSIVLGLQMTTMLKSPQKPAFHCDVVCEVQSGSLWKGHKVYAEYRRLRRWEMFAPVVAVLWRWWWWRMVVR